MPVSLFLQNASSNDGASSEFDVRRAEIIEALPRYTDRGPTDASECYAWPTSECPVGCGHCNYASPVSLNRLSRYSLARNPGPVVKVMNGMGLWKAVLSGGGEPMIEPEFCEYFIHEIDSPNLEEIELITSAHCATDEKETRDRLLRMIEAWRTRPAHRASTRFSVRVSLDWFHAQRIGVGPAAHAIRVLGEEGQRDVGCYVRSVLLDGDTTMARLAEEMGGRLSPIEDYQQYLTLPDGRELLIYYKNLIIDGRMNHRKLKRLPISVPVDSTAAEFGKRFLDAQGKHVPARTYNGPQVKFLDGVACTIEDDGKIKILEGNDPLRCPNIRGVDSWQEAMEFLYADPITVFLVDNGPLELAALMSDVFPDSATFATDTNQLYHLTELLLSSPERRLYGMLRALTQHVDEGRIVVDDALLDSGWSLLGKHGLVATKLA